MVSNQTPKYIIGFATAFVSLFPFMMLPVLGLLFVLDLLFLLVPSKFAPHSHIILGTEISTLLVIFPGIICFKVVQLSLKIFYVIHETKNKYLANAYRIIFVIGTVFLPYIAMPIYYFVYIRQERQSDIV